MITPLGNLKYRCSRLNLLASRIVSCHPNASAIVLFRMFLQKTAVDAAGSLSATGWPEWVRPSPNPVHQHYRSPGTTKTVEKKLNREIRLLDKSMPSNQSMYRPAAAIRGDSEYFTIIEMPASDAAINNRPNRSLAETLRGSIRKIARQTQGTSTVPQIVIYVSSVSIRQKGTQG